MTTTTFLPVLASELRKGDFLLAEGAGPLRFTEEILITRVWGEADLPIVYAGVEGGAFYRFRADQELTVRR